MNIILFDDIPKFITVTDPRGRHLKKVLKVRPGDTLRAGIVNGPLGEVRVISAISDDEAGGTEGYELEWRETGPAPASSPLSLIVGFVRPISAKRILREAASLGVGRLIFTVTDTGERSYREANLWKTSEWREYLINGLQTAGATVLPEVLLTGGVEEAIRAVRDISPVIWVAEEASGVRAAPPTGGQVKLMLDNVSEGRPMAEMDLRDREVVLAIGSERGWSNRERRIFTEAGFEPVGLGSRVLRTETACSVGTALALAGMGVFC